MLTQRDFPGPPTTRFSVIRLVSETGSTNRDLLDRAADAASQNQPIEEGAVLVTDHQTAGRGRQGRIWLDQPGASLLTSVLLRPAPDWAPLVPLLTGLAIADGLRAIADVEVGLKWPNDVLTADERKLAGILTEATSGRSGLTVVTGFGVNLRWTDGPPAGVPAVDLATLVVDPPERFDLLTAILVELEGRLRQIEDGDRAGILDSYRTRCISLGRRVRLATPSGDVIGDVVAVDDNGHLVIAKLDGGEVAVSAGEAHHLPPPA